MDLLSLQYILFIGALLAAFYGLPAIRESLRLMYGCSDMALATNSGLLPT